MCTYPASFTTAFNMAAHFIRTHVAALAHSRAPDPEEARSSTQAFPLANGRLNCSPLTCGRLQCSRSIALAMRNADASPRTPGSKHQVRQPSLAQTTFKLRISCATPQGLLPHLPR